VHQQQQQQGHCCNQQLQYRTPRQQVPDAHKSSSVIKKKRKPFECMAHLSGCYTWSYKYICNDEITP
jgi:hypothetical protein